MAIYATFELNNKIQEHFEGISPNSQLAGSHQNADNLVQIIYSKL